ncbi:MAG: hypothetical protein AAF191_01890 [Verrucomicrobiota bacterium]
MTRFNHLLFVFFSLVGLLQAQQSPDDYLDPYEPNNSIAQATNLSPFSGQTALPLGPATFSAVRTFVEFDWYQILVPPGHDTIQVGTSYDNTILAGTSLSLFDVNGQFLDRVTTSSGSIIHAFSIPPDNRAGGTTYFLSYNNNSFFTSPTLDLIDINTVLYNLAWRSFILPENQLTTVQPDLEAGASLASLSGSDLYQNVDTGTIGATVTRDQFGNAQIFFQVAIDIPPNGQSGSFVPSNLSTQGAVPTNLAEGSSYIDPVTGEVIGSGGLFQGQSSTVGFEGIGRVNQQNSTAPFYVPQRQISEIEVVDNPRLILRVFRLDGDTSTEVTDAMLNGTYRTASLLTGTTQQNEQFLITVEPDPVASFVQPIETVTIISRTVNDIVSGSNVSRRDVLNVQVQ